MIESLVFLRDYFWLIHGVLEKKISIYLIVFPYRDPTQVPLV